MKYKIIYSDSISSLARKMNKATKKGYRVSGGIFEDSDEDYMVILERPKKQKKVHI